MIGAAPGTPGSPTPAGHRVYGATTTPVGFLTDIWDVLTLQHLNPVQYNAPDIPPAGIPAFGEAIAGEAGTLLSDVVKPIAAPLIIVVALIVLVVTAAKK